MRKNILIKSMLRQPMRLALLCVLVALATFAGVLRTVEFLVVRDQITQAAEHYRTTGFVVHPDEFGDVSDAIALFADDPRIALHDNRRAAQGFLVDMQNTDASGMHVSASESRQNRDYLPTITEVYFYAYIGQGSYANMQMTLIVDEVLAGLPEHIVAGQRVTVVIPWQQDIDFYALSDMIVGERYLFRGAYVRRYYGDWESPLIVPFAMRSRGVGPFVPREGSHLDMLYVWPLNDESPDRDDWTWYVHAPSGRRLSFIPAELLPPSPASPTALRFTDPQIHFWYDGHPAAEVDFTLDHLAHIPDEIAMLNRNQRHIQLQTTRDMTAVPQWDTAINLLDGRLLDYYDYIYANPVAVINHRFAIGRRLGVGDTITVTIPRQQAFGGQISTPRFTVPLMLAPDDDPAEDEYEITLTIVGVYGFSSFTTYSTQSLFVFVPDSVLPAGLHIDWTPAETAPMPDVWYSFILADATYFENFFEDYRDQIAALDMHLRMNFMDPAVFWNAAAPVLMTITFNAVLFWIAVAGVIGLVAFLFLRSRNRDLAILRAIGTSTRRICVYTAIAVALVALPSVAIGGTAAWFFALNEAESTLGTFQVSYEDAAPQADFASHWATVFGDDVPIPPHMDDTRVIDMPVELSTMWLAALLAAVFVLTVAIILVGSTSILKRPVLELMQGGAGQKIRKADFAASSDDAQAPAQIVYRRVEIPDRMEHTARAARAFTRHLIFLLITRSAAKSVLGGLVALSLIFALGWIQGSINTTADEIDRLYNTAEVRVVAAANPYAEERLRHIGDVIPERAIRQVLDSGHISEYYREAGFVRSFVIAPHEDGGLPHNWAQIIDFTPARHVVSLRAFEIAGDEHFVHYTEAFSAQNRQNIDFILGINNIDAFVFRHGTGFYPDDIDGAAFASMPMDGSIPIILSQHTAYARGLNIGDTALLAFVPGLDRVTNWSFISTVVVGIHDEQIVLDNMQQAAIVPTWAFDAIFGSHGRTVYFDAAIDSALNRQLNAVRNDIRTYLNPVTALGVFAGPPPITVDFLDSELLRAATPLSQLLILLELLHPVAIVLAVAIGGGLAMLLVLQNAKNAAMLRAIGTPKAKVRLMLWAEQLAVCACGLVIGAAALMLTGAVIGDVSVALVLCLAAAAVGAAVGAIVVTGKAPLDMLQGRE